MKLISIAEYANHTKTTVQNIYDKIKRNKIKPVIIRKDVMRIPVDETTLEYVKP